ncbi:uncharacterized protein LOC135209282 [Macrobrachium nipponense]|uniref:uncharacterized protein LOC135209282 n=1 Tax=Macrobrachium nipponense TaxID=159736 RepID=UPI0030C821A4
MRDSCSDGVARPLESIESHNTDSWEERSDACEFTTGSLLHGSNAYSLYRSTGQWIFLDGSLANVTVSYFGKNNRWQAKRGSENKERTVGFMERHGRLDGIFSIRQLMEKFREKQRDLHLESPIAECQGKKYGDVPGRGWGRKSVRIIQEMYRNEYTKGRSSVGEIDGFEIGVGLHQGWALSPFIFNIVMVAMTREAVPWYICENDIVLCSERREELDGNLERWRAALEERGIRISK